MSEWIAVSEHLPPDGHYDCKIRHGNTKIEAKRTLRSNGGLPQWLEKVDVANDSADVTHWRFYHQIGNLAWLSSNATSAYHKCHGDPVKILSIDHHPSANISYRVCTFEHPKYGVGALFEYGLKASPDFERHAGNWGKEVALTKPMFTRFSKQKMGTLIGECLNDTGQKISTYLHPSLGFIALYQEEIINDTCVSAR
jgi:hypothetical protein